MSYLFPFIQFFTSILDIYSFLLIIWVILNLFNHFDIINRHHVIVMKVAHFLEALFHPPLKLLRKFIPIIGGINIAPTILYFLILLVKVMLVTFIY